MRSGLRFDVAFTGTLEFQDHGQASQAARARAQDLPRVCRDHLGVRLDIDVDWSEVAELVEDGYRMSVPKALLAMLED